MTILAPPATSVAHSPKTVTYQTLTGDVVFAFRRIRVGVAGSVHIGFADGSDDTIQANAGETLPISGVKLFGDSTATGVTLEA